ncbi:hypothetical protein [Profundibacter sp.]
MIIYYAAIFGAGLGGFTALRKKGNLFDIAQYVAIYAILFALIALFYVIFSNRGV